MAVEPYEITRVGELPAVEAVQERAHQLGVPVGDPAQLQGEPEAFGRGGRRADGEEGLGAVSGGRCGRGGRRTAAAGPPDRRRRW
ncbi:hypothetical protein O1L60_36330 [Streptomyces diastatochromogenes]|nr:hypothetical protein [Streptomyces diastatochromogenes]